MATSLYGLEQKKIFKTMKPPYPGFIVSIVEYETRGYLALRVYRDNVESFSDSQKVTLAEHLYRLRDAIRSTGVQCHIEGTEDAPSRTR